MREVMREVMRLTTLLAKYPTKPFVIDNLLAFASGNGYAVWCQVGRHYHYIGDIMQEDE